MSINVAIIGPESTGKSTLANDIASVLQCNVVPEYSREYLQHSPSYQNYDLSYIAQGQMLMEQLISYEKNIKVLDTTLDIIEIWSEYKYGKCPQWIIEYNKKIVHDIYLITNIDMPWEYDILREVPNIVERKKLLDMYTLQVRKKEKNLHIISGSSVERLQQSLFIIQNFIHPE